MKPNNYCTFYIIRHGETHANVQKILMGQLESPLNSLTDTGEKQARKVGEKLRDVHFDRAYSSDFVRAKRTAEIILLERKLALITTEVLREKSYGTFEGKQHDELITKLQIAANEVSKLSVHEKNNYKYNPESESISEAATRLTTFLREVAIANPDKTILVTSHGAIMRSFLVYLGWALYEELPTNSLLNTSYIKLRSDGVDFFIDEVYGAEKAKV